MVAAILSKSNMLTLELTHELTWISVVDAALDSVTIAADVVKMETLALAPSRLEDKPTIVISTLTLTERSFITIGSIDDLLMDHD